MTDLDKYLEEKSQDTGAHPFNSWPKLEIVNIQIVDTFLEMWNLTFTMLPSKLVYRQIAAKQIPVRVQRVLKIGRPERYGGGTEYVWFAWTLARGNAGEEGTPNVLAIFEPYKEFYDNDYRMTRGAVVVELGCEHEFTNQNLGRCYNQYTCTRCGYSYKVDSGD